MNYRGWKIITQKLGLGDKLHYRAEHPNGSLTACRPNRGLVKNDIDDAEGIARAARSIRQLTGDERRLIAAWLKDIFPWLGSDEGEVNGADTVEQLEQAYRSVGGA